MAAKSKKLDELRNIAVAHAASSQKINFRLEPWRGQFPEYHDFFLKISNPATEQFRKIERSTLYTVGKAACLDLSNSASLREAFLATMVWGRGPDNRGPALTRRMFDTPTFDAVLRDVAEAASGPDPKEAFRSLFSQRRSRIRHLGISFGTKVLHTFGNRDTGVQPLVYDVLVSNALGDLHRDTNTKGLPRARSPWRFMRSDTYLEYCEWASNLAEQWAVPPRNVEHALFVVGQQLKHKGGS
jgi:hypothetical protein